MSNTNTLLKNGYTSHSHTIHTHTTFLHSNTLNIHLKDTPDINTNTLTKDGYMQHSHTIHIHTTFIYSNTLNVYTHIRTSHSHTQSLSAYTLHKHITHTRATQTYNTHALTSNYTFIPGIHTNAHVKSPLISHSHTTQVHTMHMHSGPLTVTFTPYLLHQTQRTGTLQTSHTVILTSHTHTHMQ